MRVNQVLLTAKKKNKRLRRIQKPRAQRRVSVHFVPGGDFWFCSFLRLSSCLFHSIQCISCTTKLPRIHIWSAISHHKSVDRDQVWKCAIWDVRWVFQKIDSVQTTTTNPTNTSEIDWLHEMTVSDTFEKEKEILQIKVCVFFKWKVHDLGGDTITFLY